MPIEVIELPSSPEQCQPVSKALPKPRSTQKLKANPFNDESHNSNNKWNEEGWFVISDNEDLNSPSKTSVKRQDQSKALGAGVVDKKRRTLAPGSLRDYGGAPDPFDIENDYGGVFNSALLPSKDGKTSSKTGFGRVDAAPIGSDDFFYLSDNFDNPINLGCPFKVSSRANEAKKRRLPQESDFKPLSKRPVLEEKGFRRVLSDTGHKSRTGDEVPKTGEFSQSKKMVADSDPIDLSSEDEYSRLARQRRMKARQMRDLEWGSDCDNGDSLLRSVPRKRKRPSKLPSGADISSDMDMPDVRVFASSISASNQSSNFHMDSAQILAKYNAERAADQKSREKAVAAQQKALAREAEKERKLLAKAEKAREKETAAALARVNTMRIDKKVSTSEMIVDFPMDVDSKLADQICSFLNPMSVECQPWLSTIPNVFKWRRKAEAVYNEDERRWEPTKKYVKEENQVMCYMLASEFVDLAVGVEGHDLTTHVLKMKAKFVDCTIIYLIEGLAAWMRKNKNIRNRQFTEAVRSQLSQDCDNTSSSQRQKKAKKQQVYMDADMVEDELLRLQVIHGALIHHTAAMIETAQWVVAFTQHISTIPGRLEKMSLATGFCMDSGQVKTGENPADTFVKMLQEITRVTPPMAYGIAAEYPSAKKLIEGFEEGGKDILTSLKKSSNKDGALTDREIGKKVSRRVWGIFMSRDETSTDI